MTGETLLKIIITFLKRLGMLFWLVARNCLRFRTVFPLFQSGILRHGPGRVRLF